MKKRLIQIFLAIVFIMISCIPASAASDKDSFDLNRTPVFDKAYYIIANYGDTITKASNTFGIPHQVLVNLILSTSGGDPLATNDGTNARGLVLVKEDIFNNARAQLADQGIQIAGNRFDPAASIFAAAWYLDRIYQNSVGDYETFPFDRKNVKDWESAMAFYTARLNTTASRTYDQGFD